MLRPDTSGTKIIFRECDRLAITIKLSLQLAFTTHKSGWEYIAILNVSLTIFSLPFFTLCSLWFIKFLRLIVYKPNWEWVHICNRHPYHR